MYYNQDPTYPQNQPRAGDLVPMNVSRPMVFVPAETTVRMAVAPFSPKYGLLGQTAKFVISDMLDFLLYRPSAWQWNKYRGIVRYPGVPGLRGMFVGPPKVSRYSLYDRMFAWTSRFSHKMGKTVVRAMFKSMGYNEYFMKEMLKEYERGGLHRVFSAYENYARSYIGKAEEAGLKDVAARVQGKLNFINKLQKISRKISPGYIKVSPTIAKIGRGVSTAMLAYESVKGIAWLTSKALNAGVSLMNKAASLLRDGYSMRYRLPAGYVTPEAATIRNRALQEIHASRSNVRNILLGNEAFYSHR